MNKAATAILLVLVIAMMLTHSAFFSALSDANSIAGDVDERQDQGLETGLYPKAAQRLRILQKLKKLNFESFETVIEHFIDDDPKEALIMAANTAATPMMNLLLMSDEGLSLLTLLSAIIFGAELVTDGGEQTKPKLRLMTNHKNIQVEFPLENITAALWVNVQEEAAKLRDKLNESNEKPE